MLQRVSNNPPTLRVMSSKKSRPSSDDLAPNHIRQLDRNQGFRDITLSLISSGEAPAPISSVAVILSED
jgi:hypothetical protein